MINNNFTWILLKWFEENGRDLPWRDTKDPYAIWLSEVILQQTRIQQGLCVLGKIYATISNSERPC